MCRWTLVALAILTLPLPASAQTHQATPALQQVQPVSPALHADDKEADDPMLADLPAPRRVVSSWNEALAVAESNSPDLRIAYNAIRSAEAQTRIALAAALPSAVGQASYTQNFFTIPAGAGGQLGVISPTLQATTTQGYASGYVQVVQPIVAFQAWHAVGTGHAMEDVARLSAAELKRATVMHLASTMLGVVTAERIAELNRSGLRSALRRLQLARTRETLGGGTGQDLARAREDVDIARATLLSGDESLLQAREEFGLGLGLAEPVGMAPGSRMDGLDVTAREACSGIDSAEARADVAAARKRADVARRNVTDVYEQFLPTLGAQGSVGATTLSTPDVASTVWSIQAILTVPIWDGGARYAALKNMRAVRDTADIQLGAVRRAATVQIDQARRGVKVAERLLAVAKDARAQASDVDRITQQAYLAGKGTSLDLISAATALRQSEANLAVLEYGVVKARIMSMLSLSDCRL